MKKSRERTDLGNRGRRRNKEDGEATGAQSALALRLELVCDWGTAECWSIIPRAAVPLSKKLGGVQTDMVLMASRLIDCWSS